jgi:phage baseplate assembly protein W
VSQLSLTFPRPWPHGGILLPMHLHAELGYVLTVPMYTPDGRRVNTRAVGTQVEKLLDARCRSGELNMRAAREEAAKIAEAIVRGMKPPRARP